MYKHKPLFPINHKDVFDIYGKMKRAAWNESTVMDKVKADIKEVSILKPQELLLLKVPVAAFSVIENVIIDNLHRTYFDHFNEPEYQLAFGMQSQIEGIHQICYGELLKCYFDNEIGLELNPIIKSKSEWVNKYFKRDPYSELTDHEFNLLKASSTKPWLMKRPNKSKRLAKEILVSLILEGVDITSNFSLIFLFRENGMLPGFTGLNEYIELDEWYHYELFITLYHKLGYRLSFKTVCKVMSEWLDLALIQYSCLQGVDALGFNYDQFISNTHFNLNLLMTNLGYAEPFIKGGKQLPYMSKRDIGIRSSRFFETINTGYEEPNYTEEDLELTF